MAPSTPDAGVAPGYRALQMSADRPYRTLPRPLDPHRPAQRSCGCTTADLMWYLNQVPLASQMIDTGIKSISKARMPGFQYPKSSKSTSFFGPRGLDLLHTILPRTWNQMCHSSIPKIPTIQRTSRCLLSEVASTAPFGCFGCQAATPAEVWLDQDASCNFAVVRSVRFL